MSFHEDSKADVDFNMAMSGDGKVIEIQSSAERTAFSLEEMNHLINLARSGIGELIKIQKEALKPLLQESCYLKITQDCIL
jgi:ribonuclease PH